VQPTRSTRGQRVEAVMNLSEEEAEASLLRELEHSQP
jgi:hypothetical protein